VATQQKVEDDFAHERASRPELRHPGYEQPIGGGGPAIGDEQVDRRPVGAALLSRRHRHRLGQLSLSDRSESSSLAESAASATEQQSRSRYDSVVLYARTGAPVGVDGMLVGRAKAGVANRTHRTASGAQIQVPDRVGRRFSAWIGPWRFESSRAQWERRVARGFVIVGLRLPMSGPGWVLPPAAAVTSEAAAGTDQGPTGL
jgi:hypothetical protein